MRFAPTVAIAALIAATLSSCSSPPPPAPIDIVVAVGLEANAPVPVMTEEMFAVFTEATVSNGNYTIISVDGEPYVYDYNVLGSDSSESEIVEQEQQNTLATFGQTMLGAVPKTAETDPLGALILASRSFTHPGRERRVLMISSGLSTVNPLDLSIGENLYADVDAVVSDLATRSLLPHLDGITVYWSGLGDTVAPQSRLTASARQNLLLLWEKLIAASGGRLVMLDASLPPTLPSQLVDDLPDVSEVRVRPEASLTAPVEFLEDSIRFEADSGVYLDGPAARAALGPVAELISSTSTAVTVTGVTARQRTREDQLSTGLARANSVRQTLIELGVEPALVSTNSVGSYWDCYVEERRTDGTTDEALSAANRKIILTASGQSITDVCE